jgi:hypothetical protein
MTDPKANLPKEKQTVLGLYIKANEGYEPVAKAQPLKDGWKNSGCPWTKKNKPERMVLPQG